jgi:hypothetical protein
MWEWATVVAGPGTGSGWVDEHFISDNQPIDQPSPGVPACAAQQTATGSESQCSGSACNGQDPAAEGCSGDATTLESVMANDYTIELRYSPSCQAAWMRGTGGFNDPNSCNGWTQEYLGRIEGSSDGGQTLAAVNETCMDGGTFWTTMVSAADYSTRACLVFADSPRDTPVQPEAYVECTGWH